MRLFGIALLTVRLSVSFSSCSKSDDDNDNNPLVGTWVEKSTDTYHDYITFKANGTGLAGDWDKGDRDKDAEAFKYKYTDTTLSIDWGKGSYKEYQYSISGNTLTLSIEDRTTIYIKQ